MPRDHVVEGEMAGFLGHLGVEDDLELQVAELVGERVHVVAGNGVGDLIGFLDRVRRDGRETLLAIPFATALGVAEAAHDRDQPVDRAFRRHERGPACSVVKV